MIWTYATFTKYCLSVFDAGEEWVDGYLIRERINTRCNENIGSGRFYVFMARMVRDGVLERRQGEDLVIDGERIKTFFWRRK